MMNNDVLERHETTRRSRRVTIPMHVYNFVFDDKMKNHLICILLKFLKIIKYLLFHIQYKICKYRNITTTVCEMFDTCNP